MSSHSRAAIAMAKAQMALERPDEPRVKDGWVYLIGAPFVGAVKIGWAISPISRYDQISATCPTPLILLSGLKGTVKDEQALHRRFKAYRYHREWFRYEGEIIEFCDETRAKNGIAPWPPLQHSSSVREPIVWTYTT